MRLAQTELAISRFVESERMNSPYNAEQLAAHTFLSRDVYEKSVLNDIVIEGLDSSVQ